jgi:DNA-binding transcriptional MerR regulator
MINPNSVNTLAEGYELQIATLKQQLEEYQDRLAKALGILDADCQFEAEANLHKLKQQNAELLKALETFIDSHEECTDFDGFTAQIVSMDEYHEAQEAIASAEGM